MRATLRRGYSTASGHSRQACPITAPTSCHSENDLRQASGKGWEAAERIVKAVADARGWPHSSRHDLYRAVGRLAKEMPDAQLQTLFTSANALDQNFHEGWMTEDAVEQALDEVEEFAGRLADLIA